MKGGIRNVANTHYDPLFEKKRALLPTIIAQELTQRQQQVIHLFYVEELNDAQVAKKLGITPASAQRLRRRAEARIAHFLQYCT